MDKARFDAKIMPVTESGCHLWVGASTSDGCYGVACVKRRRRLAHRLAFALHHGREPGPILDHLCRVTRCVNPLHLEEVTARENLLRGNNLAAQRARQTHCKRGHEFTLANTYRTKRGNWRSCRRCNADKTRAARDIVKAMRKKKGLPTGPARTGTPILIRVPATVLRTFDQLARDAAMSRAALMRRALAEWLEMETELAA